MRLQRTPWKEPAPDFGHAGVAQRLACYFQDMLLLTRTAVKAHSLGPYGMTLHAMIWKAFDAALQFQRPLHTDGHATGI